jgi:hypothetical protein
MNGMDISLAFFEIVGCHNTSWDVMASIPPEKTKI